MVCRDRGKPPQLSLIPEVSVAHHQGIPKQKSLVAPNTSEGTTEKDIVVEYHLLLLSLPWEDTHPAAATAKSA